MSFEKLDPPEIVIEVSLERAAAAGKEAARVATDPLYVHAGPRNIFRMSQVIDYGTIVRDKAAEQYLAERIAGLHNDEASTRPGLTALLLRPSAVSRIDRVLGNQPQGNLFGIVIEAIEAESPEQLFTMRLPQGGYEERPNDIHFCDVVEPTGAHFVQPTESSSTTFRVPKYNVVTIMGDDGEYWQNPRLNLDGTRKS